MKTKQLLAATALALCALSGNLAHAQVSTGSLAGWSVLGDVVADSGAITLTTAFLDGGTDEAHNVSGASAAIIFDLVDAAGVALEAFDLTPSHQAYEGSLIGQSFAASAGQILSFDWAFSTYDDQYLDHAFVVIDGNVFTLATTAQPGLALQKFSYTVGQTGPLSLALGVVDTDDFDGVSLLNVSNLQLSAVTAPVPEPSTWALLAGGLGVVGWSVRRRLPAAA